MSKKSTLTKKIVAKLGLGTIHEFLDCEDLSLLANDNYRAIDDSHVDKLTLSIKEAGLKTQVSLIVKVSPDGQRTCLIEDGHHRVEAVRRLRERAAKTGNAWLSRPLPCRVKVVATDSGENKTAVDSVMMNQLTKEETIWDKADAYKRLREAGETTASISAMVGVDERSVRRTLSLLKIPPDVRAFAEANLDSVKTASLYKLASVISAPVETTLLEEKSVEDLLFKKASNKAPQAGKSAVTVSKAAVTKEATDQRRQAVRSNHVAMAAYLALDFIEMADLAADGEQNALQGSRNDKPGKEPKSKTENGAKNKHRGSRQDLSRSGEVLTAEDKNHWRTEVMARIEKIGLDDVTLEAVKAAIVG
jgi:hypothetical protein